MSHSQDLANALSGITKRLDKIDEGLRENANKEDIVNIHARRKTMTNHINKNTDNIEWLMNRRKDDEKDVQQVVRQTVDKYVDSQLAKQVEEKVARAERGENCQEAAANIERIRKHEDAEYYKARRSMRMWPIPDGDECAEKAARDFMWNVLEVPRITISRIRIEFV